MERAITAARRAFDETTGRPTGRSASAACSSSRTRSEAQGRTAAEIVAEVGAPIGVTTRSSWSSCRRHAWAIDMIDKYEFEHELGRPSSSGMPSNRARCEEPIGVVGAIVPWNFPFMVNLSKIGRRWPPAAP